MKYHAQNAFILANADINFIASGVGLGTYAEGRLTYDQDREAAWRGGAPRRVGEDGR